MEIYAWLIVFAAALFIEGMTNTLIAVWFAPSALICLALSLFGVPLWAQITVFVMLSALLMLLFYKKLRDNIAAKSEKTNLDAIIGKTAVVEEDIEPLGVGRVKVGGISWSAYIAPDASTVTKGEYVIIKEINGVKLLCEKVETPAEKSYVFTDK